MPYTEMNIIFFLHQKIDEQKRLAYIGWQDHNYIVHEIKTSTCISDVYSVLNVYTSKYYVENTRKSHNVPPYAHTFKSVDARQNFKH